MPHVELQPVLNRLKTRIIEGDLYKRTEGVIQLIDDFKHKYEYDRTSIYQNLRIGYETFQERGGYKELMQNNLIAYLFLQNRKEYGDHYDFDKEKRQIKATLALLNGDHVHMGTGEGKTTTVLPIASLVDALTSDKKTAILTSTDEALLSELKYHTKKFQNILKGVLSDALSIKFVDGKKSKEESIINTDLRKQMVTEALTYDHYYSKKTNIAIRDKFWDLEKKQDTKKRKKDFLDQPKKETRILFLTDRDLVFKFQEDQKRFVENVPNIYFDEADVPYNRRTPYVNIGENYFSEKEVIESTSEWMTRFIISNQISETDFVDDQGGFSLSNNAYIKLGKIKFSDHFKHYNAHQPNIKDPLIATFEKGIDIIAKKLGFTPDQKIQMAAFLASKYTIASPDPYILQTIGKQIANLNKKKGLMYDISADGPIVRDSYIDQFLHDHKFSWEEQLNILALEGMFDFISTNPVAYKTTTFPTFVVNLKNQLRCASGTLMFPDPETYKIKESSFARFLKNATGKKTILVSPSEIKNVPDPQIFEKEDEAIRSLVNSVAADNKTLIISYHIEKSRQIYQELVNKFGEGQVAYVPSKPSKADEVKKYQKRVKKIYQDLADGKLKAVVSSGAAGFGVNIVQSDGTFPDLHIAIHDLPANRSQLMQILGRRRALGDNFSWFISQEFLTPYIMLFEDRVGKTSHFMGKIDALKIKEKLSQAKNNPEAGEKIILEILKKIESSENKDDEYTILFDRFMDTVNGRLNRVYQRSLFVDTAKYGRHAFRFFLQHLGLPDSLRTFVTTLQPFTPQYYQSSGNEERLKKLYQYLIETDENHTSLLAEQAYSYYLQRREIVADYYNVVTGDGRLYFHQPVPKTKQFGFSPKIKDSQDPRVTWGILTMKIGEDKSKITVLSYKTRGRIYSLRNSRGNLVINPADHISPIGLKFANPDVSHNIFGRRYSFLTN